MIVYIYGLRDPVTEEIRYIGKANNPKKRLINHMHCNDANKHKDNWIISLKKIGLKPELIILEETNDQEWETREKHWIKHGWNSGWRLTNICEGGMNNYYPSYNNIDKNLLLQFVDNSNVEKLYKLSQDEINDIAKGMIIISVSRMKGYFTGKTDGIEAYKASHKYINERLSL